MVIVGVRELKANLSRYLETARRGDVVEVRSRGTVIARVVGAEQRSERSVEEALAELAESGLLELPDARVRSKLPRLVRTSGTDTSELVRRARR